MKALFADLGERDRQHHARSRAQLANERNQVVALFDAVQVAIAQGQHDRADILLAQLRAVVSGAVANRQRRRRIST